MVLPHERDSIALAVALANTWDVLNDPPEHLDDVEMLRLILRAFELHDEAERAREGDLAPLRAMRDRIRTAFGTSAGDAGYLWYFDFDGDGHVDGRDKVQFSRRFGQE